MRVIFIKAQTEIFNGIVMKVGQIVCWPQANCCRLYLLLRLVLFQLYKSKSNFYANRNPSGKKLTD